MKYSFIILQLRVFKFFTSILMTCVHDIWSLVLVLLRGRRKHRTLRCSTHEDGGQHQSEQLLKCNDRGIAKYWWLVGWLHICLQECSQGNVDVPQMKVSSNHSWKQHPCDGVKLGSCQASHGSSASLVELGAGLWLLPKLADWKVAQVSVHYTEECKRILGPAVGRVCNGGNSWVQCPLLYVAQYVNSALDFC